MNKPKIRFKGFEGEWKDVKLSSIAIFSKGQGYSKSDLRENGHPIILYGRMYTKYQFAINEVDTFSNLKGAYVLSEGNEIIMPASGETPEDIACASAVLAKGIILGGDLNIVRFDLKKYSTPFLALTITYSKTHYDLSKCAQGKSVVHLHNEAISKTAVSIPSLPEQRALASYFTSLDAQIAASSSRLSSLKQIKAASLLNMFPQKGEMVPRVRFKGFQGEWKEIKLGEIFSVEIGEFVIKTKQKNNAPYPVYNGGVSNTGFYDCYNQEGPKIIVSARGANAGYVNYCTTDFWAGNSCYSIGAKNNDELKFFFYFLKRFQEIYMKNQYSASIPSISKQQILRTNLIYPSLSEQRAIASYFTALDAQITLHRERLEKLKQIKAACLEKMFA